MKIGSRVRINSPGHIWDGRTGTLEYLEGGNAYVKIGDEIRSVPMREVEIRNVAEHVIAPQGGDLLDYEDDEKCAVDLSIERWKK